MPLRHRDTEKLIKKKSRVNRFCFPSRSLCLCVSVAILFLSVSCSRFRNSPTNTGPQRYVVISPIYNEIIWALGAQDEVVGVDLSTTYPPDVKNKQTVGYHRALSAEGILSLHPTAVIHED